jgi:hypothetical protein
LVQIQPKRLFSPGGTVVQADKATAKSARKRSLTDS